MLATGDLLYDNDAMSKKWTALLLIGCGILIVLMALVYGVYEQKVKQINPASLPGEVAGLPLEGSIYGGPALAELSWMHGQEFQLNEGAVGSYGEATLYVAGTPLSFMAKRMMVDMRDKIVGSETPFTPLNEMKYGSRTVYELVGMGQQHYYFRSGNLVIWLAANEQVAELALQEALDFYP